MGKTIVTRATRKKVREGIPACPKCESHSVYWREGPKTMRCKRCGNTYSLPGNEPKAKA